MSGFYSLSVIASEMVHFHVNFPVAEGEKAGGLGSPGGFRGQLQSVVINIAKEGLPKRICCPWIVGISTHWITNIDEKEYNKTSSVASSKYSRAFFRLVFSHPTRVARSRNSL